MDPSFLFFLEYDEEELLERTTTLQGRDTISKLSCVLWETERYALSCLLAPLFPIWLVARTRTIKRIFPTQKIPFLYGYSFHRRKAYP